MTESEIQALISQVDTAMTNILLTGQEYTINTNGSSRTFKAADLDKLRSWRFELNQMLQDEQETSGILVGF